MELTCPNLAVLTKLYPHHNCLVWIVKTPSFLIYDVLNLLKVCFVSLESSTMSFVFRFNTWSPAVHMGIKDVVSWYLCKPPKRISWLQFMIPIISNAKKLVKNCVRNTTLFFHFWLQRNRHQAGLLLRFSSGLHIFQLNLSFLHSLPYMHICRHIHTQLLMRALMHSKQACNIVYLWGTNLTDFFFFSVWYEMSFYSQGLKFLSQLLSGTK